MEYKSANNQFSIDERYCKKLLEYYVAKCVDLESQVRLLENHIDTLTYNYDSLVSERCKLKTQLLMLNLELDNLRLHLHTD